MTTATSAPALRFSGVTKRFSGGTTALADADLVALPAGDALEALGGASAHRTVWRAGAIVARTTVRTEISSPAARDPFNPAGRPDAAQSTAMEGAAS